MDNRSQNGNLIAKALMAAVVLTGSCLLSPAVMAETFSDVPTDYWAYDFIETLAAQGVTGGCGNGQYCPEAPVTRAQMAVFLERGLKGSDYAPPAATGNVFLDIAAEDFAASFIEQLYLDGITGGCGGNNYCPDQSVSRAQMAVFLLRAKYGGGYVPPVATGVFVDVDSGYWAASWIEQLAAEGITSGCGNGSYCPEDSVNRAQMAVFLVRTFALDAPPASLSSLGLSAGTLDPAFSPTTYDYEVSVGTPLITVTARAGNGNDVVTIDGVIVPSADPSKTIGLEPGNNTISIIVTSSDGQASNAYTVRVRRETIQPTKILDSSTILPDGDTFACAGFPNIDVGAGKVVFENSGASFSGQKLFVYENGSLRLMVSASDPAPGDASYASQFVDTAIDGDSIYFTTAAGAYVESNGVISLIADATQATPAGGGNYGAFGGIDAANGVAVFRSLKADGSSAIIYSFDGSDIEVVADTGDVFGASDPLIGNGIIVFAVDTSVQSTIYAYDGGNLIPIADSSAQLPNLRDTLTNPSLFLMDENGRILLEATDGALGSPIYAWQSGNLSLFIDVPKTLAVTGTEFLDSLLFAAVNNTYLVTRGYPLQSGSAPIGLYVFRDSTAGRAIEAGEILDGREVLNVFPAGLDGNVLVIFVEFLDGSCGLYSTELAQ